MKRLLILLTLLALLLSLTACMSGKPEIINDPGFETLEVHEKEDNVVEDDDWDDWDSEPAPTADPAPQTAQEPAPSVTVTEDGEYTSRDEVALYLHTYGHLPSNYITKKEAQALGWDSSWNYVSDVAPGMSIGGDYFGNYEQKLPVVKGRKYYEADCFYQGGKRNAYRIIYSTDGHVWYTEDHYNTFIELFPTEGGSVKQNE